MGVLSKGQLFRWVVVLGFSVSSEVGWTAPRENSLLQTQGVPLSSDVRFSSHRKPAAREKKVRQASTLHLFQSAVGPELQKYVQFWIRIYSEYNSSQGLIHDSKHPSVVYEVLDLNGLTKRQVRKRIRAARTKWKSILYSVHRKRKSPEKMTEVERYVYQLFANIDADTAPEISMKFAQARGRKRVRFQRGLKDRFKQAIIDSGRYLPLMERVFKEKGLPIELTRIPFVESSFNVRARSKVGASGVWQFMRSTGKLYLRVDSIVDERNDPVRATEAAAKLLKTNYESLRSWPLAVIAYNHGRMGMMRAVRKVGSIDLKEIVEKYRSRRFGFASRNFFFEFVAAIEVEKHSEQYFGRLEKAKEFDYVEVGISDYISALDLSNQLELDLEQFKQLNPSFTHRVWSGRKRIPALYRIRIPANWGLEKGGPREAFWTRYSEIPRSLKYRFQKGSRYKRNLSSRQRSRSGLKSVSQ